MSSGFSIRAHAKPYFAVWSARRPFSLADNQFSGETTVEIQLALYAPPARLAADDESHALFALFVDRLNSRLDVPLLTIGLTPFGGVRVDMCGGYVAKSQQGQFAADGRFRTLVVATTLAGVFEVLVDGTALAMTPAGAVNLTVPHGYQTALMLFNDCFGRTRLDAAIRRVALGNDNLGLAYPFEEGHGLDVAATVIDPDSVTTGSADLTAEFYNPLADYAYGPPPTPRADVHSAFNWQLRTDYRRRVKTPTVFRRRRTTWPV